MRTPEAISLQIRELQRAVANPEVSAWVAANAGSGKTHVLAQRVINLLLKGVQPEKILCITFTKAARSMPQSARAPLSSLTLPGARWRGVCSPAHWKPQADLKCRRSMRFAPSCCINFRSRPTSLRVLMCWMKPNRLSFWSD
jgi:hypothetical protein